MQNMWIFHVRASRSAWFQPAMTTILAPIQITLAKVWSDLVALFTIQD